MNLRGKRFLVIGGAGLIGSHTIDELLKEDIEELVVFDNFCRGSAENLQRALKDSRCTIYEAGGDILQTDILNAAMQGVDGVLHFAALWLLQCYEYPRAAFEVNVKGTFNVIEACVQNHVERLVYSSSASVYGNAVSEPMTEEHKYNNTTFYGATKIAGEHMCRSFHHRYGLNYVGLRYMNVYGPRQDYRGVYTAVIMKILQRLDQGLAPVIYGDGSQAYDFVNVKDCAKANVSALKSDSTDEFYNVGTGIRTTIKELAQMLIRLTGSDQKIQYEPEEVSFVNNRIGCTVKAREDLGFMADIALEKGLLELIQWRQSHIDGSGRQHKPLSK